MQAVFHSGGVEMLAGRSMRVFSLCTAALLAACGGASESSITNPPKPKAVDPAISIRVVNQLDTATARGRALYSIFALIYSVDPLKAGVAFVGAPNPLGQPGNQDCVAFQADSIGARFVILLALADTTKPTAFATAQATAQTWYNGDHALPPGWFALTTDSLDWGVSTQFTNGHGLTTGDPIRWDVTWSGMGTITRAEAPNDTTCH